MVAAQRGQPETAVVLGIVFRAHPKPTEVQQTEAGGQGPFEGHPRQLQVLGDQGAGSGKTLPECHDVIDREDQHPPGAGLRPDRA